MSFLTAWVVMGMLVCSGPWANKKHPFIVDYISGILMLALWPLIPLIRSRK